LIKKEITPHSSFKPPETPTLPPPDIKKEAPIRKVTLIPGDGIGEEISQAVVQIFAASKVPLSWETVKVSTTTAKEGSLSSLLGGQVIESVKETKLALKGVPLPSRREHGEGRCWFPPTKKGPLATPIGKGHMSLNLALRKQFSLYANVRPARSIPGVKTPYDNVDIVVIRENTEGEYSGIEHQVRVACCLLASHQQTRPPKGGWTHPLKERTVSDRLLLCGRGLGRAWRVSVD